jgi:hypothetical protein
MSNYSGSFVLNGITQLVGRVDVWSVGGPAMAAPNLTSIELPDLVSLGGLSLQGAPALTSISAPKVTTIGNLTLYQLADAASIAIDFSSLTSASSISIYGQGTLPG